MQHLLRDLFRLSDVRSFSGISGGLMSQNFRVETDRGAFFLKQYSNRVNTVIHEIKIAEQYFSEHGFPIILPVKDRYAREAFWMNGNWYSLFPFIEGISPAPQDVSPIHVRAMADQLARLHQTGMRFRQRPFQLQRIGNARLFHLETVELFRILESKKPLSELDEKVKALLLYKTQRIAKHTNTPMDFGATYESLIHGDYQYANLFFDEHGQITHVFDLERAALGWTAYELARSIMITCFDGGWDEKHYALARLFVRTYLTYLPLSFETYERAIRYYGYSLLFSSWIELRYLVYGMNAQLSVFDAHVKRVEFFTQSDIREFCQRTFAN